MSLVCNSPCKINLILNILGRRPDGFHELETVFQPVPLHDTIEVARRDTAGVQFFCDHPGLPDDGSNLAVRAARAFLDAAKISEGVSIRLSKSIPLAAGLAGGSSNAAVTLKALNELFGGPLEPATLSGLAQALGSDVAFFLQDRPALAVGRGEHVQPLDAFAALKGTTLVLIHPGFGISTAWAYRELAHHPAALQGIPGRAAKLVESLRTQPLGIVGKEFYNSLEAPAIRKYPVLALYQDHLWGSGAEAAMMSGSGSTTFSFFPSSSSAERAIETFRSEFGTEAWVRMIPMP